MVGETTRTLRLCAEGPFALFTAPAFKTEKVTYDVLTVPAARGIVQAILWKPAVDVEILEIDVCNPIRRHTMSVNGVARKTPLPSKRHIAGEKSPQDLVQNVMDMRLQTRNTLLLDVRYVIHFRYYLTDRAGDGDTPEKFEEMFERRLEQGQRYRLPHFGCQQYFADCRPVRDSDVPIQEDRDLGMMPHVRLYGTEVVHTLYYHARLESGTVVVPPQQQIREAGIAALDTSNGSLPRTLDEIADARPDLRTELDAVRAAAPLADAQPESLQAWKERELERLRLQVRQELELEQLEAKQAEERAALALRQGDDAPRKRGKRSGRGRRGGKE